MSISIQFFITYALVAMSLGYFIYHWKKPKPVTVSANNVASGCSSCQRCPLGQCVKKS